MKAFYFLRKIGRPGWKDVVWFGAVFFGTYLLYLFTLYPSVATEDAGEFSTAVATLGVAHPPGYPLYSILGKIFTLFVPFGSMAWKVNLFSAFCGAAAAGLFYLCLRILTRKKLLSFLGALIFGAGGIFWSQAVRAEVYTLNTALFLFILFLLLLWFERRGKLDENESKNFLLSTAFLYGLSLGNHYLMFLAGIPFFIFAMMAAPKFFRDWKFLGKAMLFFGCGLAVYLYLPIRAAMHPGLNWGDPSTWQGFWDTVTRKLYSSGSIDASMQLVPAKQSGPGFLSGSWFGNLWSYHLWQMLWYVLQHFSEDFFWGLLIFSPFGLWWLRKKSKVHFWLMIALFGFYSLALSDLLGLGFTDKLPVDFFKDRPFFIPVLTVLCFLSILGVHDVAEKFFKRGARKIVAVLLAGLLVFNIFTHFGAEDQSHNYVAHDLAKLILDILPPNAVYIVQNGDNTLFPILYMNKVEGLRRDVRFYIPSPINVYDFFTDFQTLEKQNPGRRIFTDFPFADYPGKTYAYLGPISEIVPVQNIDMQKAIIPLLEKTVIRGISSGNLDHFNAYLKGRFALDLGLAFGGIDDLQQSKLFADATTSAPGSVNIFSQLIGNYYVRRSAFREAISYLEKAHTFYPEEYPINFELLLSYIMIGDPQHAEPYFMTLVQNNRDLFLNEYAKLKTLFPDASRQFDAFEKFLQQRAQ